MLHVLRVCCGDNVSQYRWMAALQGFVQNPLNAQHAVAHGAFEAILQLLPSCTGLEPRRLRQACIVLQTLIINADAVERAVRVGAIDVVMTWLRVHPRDELVQTGGWCILGVLCEHNHVNMIPLLDGGAASMLQDALRAHRGCANLQFSAASLLALLQQQQQRAARRAAAAPPDAAAIAAADAAMAALLAEEEAERGAKVASAAARKSKKSKKKRDSGGGASGAAGASCDDAVAVDEPAAHAAVDDHADADANAAASSAAALTVSAADDAPRAPAAPAPSADAPDRAAEAEVDGAMPGGDVFAAVMPAAAAQQSDDGAPSGAAASGVVMPSAAVDAAAGPRRAPRDYRPPMGAPPPHDAGAPSFLPPPPSFLPPPPSMQPPAQQPAPPPLHGAAPEGAAASADASLSGLLAGLALVAPPPPAAAALPAAAPPPPPPVMRECCICFLDVLQDELRLLSPCGHRCVCAECASVLTARPPASRLCPKCRELVVCATRVFDE
jgi:hypothetical protein